MNRRGGGWRKEHYVVLFVSLSIILFKWLAIVHAGSFMRAYYDAPRHLRVVQRILVERAVPRDDPEFAFRGVMYPPGMHILVTATVLLTALDPANGVDVLMLFTSFFALGATYLIGKGLLRSRALALIAMFLYSVFRPMPVFSGSLFGISGVFALSMYFLFHHCRTDGRRSYILTGVLLTISFVFHHATYSYTAGGLLLFLFLSVIFKGGRHTLRMVDVLGLIAIPWVTAYGWWSNFPMDDFLAFYLYPLSESIHAITVPSNFFLVMLAFIVINIGIRLTTPHILLTERKVPFALSHILALCIALLMLSSPGFNSPLRPPYGGASWCLYTSVMIILFLSRSDHPLLLAPLSLLITALGVESFQGSIVGRTPDYWSLFALVVFAKGITTISRFRNIISLFLILVFIQTLFGEVYMHGTNPFVNSFPSYQWVNDNLPASTIVPDFDYFSAFRHLPDDARTSLAIVEGRIGPRPGDAILVLQGTKLDQWDSGSTDRIFDSRAVRVFIPLCPGEGCPSMTVLDDSAS